MSVATEDWFSLKDGTKLYTKSWKPSAGSSTAALVFIHGFSDHCNAYYDFFPTLAAPPYSIAVYAFDQRGWGRSVKKQSDKGLTGPTSLVLADIHEFVRHVASLPDTQAKPLFVMGHSMGGGEALHYALSTSSALADRPPLAGLLLEAPFIELDPASEPWSITVYAGKLAAKLLPHAQMKQKLDPTYMSRSARVRQEWVDDPLCHDTGTFAGLDGMLQRSADLSRLSRAQKVSSLSTSVPCPLWFSHGTSDHVISYPSSKRLFAVLKAPKDDKTFKAYADAYHKLHAEPDGVGEQFAKDVGEWIIAHAAKDGDAAQDPTATSGEMRSKL